MNILQLHWGFILGGGSRYVQMIERMAARHGIGSHCLCIIDPRWSSDEDGLQRIAHTRIATNGRLDPSWIEPVAAHIQERSPDVLMTHGFNAHFVAWIAQRRLRTHIPVACSYHGPYHALNLRTRAFGLAYDRFTEIFFRRDAAAVVTVAQHARRRLIRRGVPAEKITVIPNAIEDIATDSSAEFRAMWRRRWGVGDAELLIGAVGRLDPVKGHSFLLEAFESIAAKHSHVRLVLVGDGPNRMRIEELVSRSRYVSRILLVGGIPAAADTLPAFDIYVLPSLSECHSIALLEAMRAGLPVVATAVGGNVETIEHAKEGMLVAPADVRALAECIARCIDNRDFACSLGLAARARFLRDFTQDSFMERSAGWLRRCGARMG